VLSRIRSQLTYANVVGTLALFIALGGSAYAAVTLPLPPNIVGTKQIKNKAVTPPKLASSTMSLLKGRTGPPGRPGQNGSNATINGVAAGGDLTGAYPAPTIVPGAVSTAKLADAAITTSKFAPGARAPDAAKLAGEGPTDFGAVMSGGILGLSSTSGTTDYGAPTGISTATAFESNVDTWSPAVALYARDLSVELSDIGGTGVGRTLALVVNGTVTSLQCTTGGSNFVGTCTDTSDVVAVPANSRLSIADIVAPGSPPTTTARFGFRLTSS
jgi:hypothetical protein